MKKIISLSLILVIGFVFVGLTRADNIYNVDLATTPVTVSSVPCMITGGIFTNNLGITVTISLRDSTTKKIDIQLITGTNSLIIPLRDYFGDISCDTSFTVVSSTTGSTNQTLFWRR